MAKKSPKKTGGGQKPKTTENIKKGATNKTEPKAAPKKQLSEPGPDLFEKVLGKKSVFVMAGLMALLLLVVFGGFAFGDKLFLFKDIGSDTINVFYPQLVHIADYLATDGIPKWSFNQGMGQNVLPLSIGDPFNWILFMMGKESLAYGIVWVEMLKIFTAGMLFYGFLRELKINYQTSMIGGILYAFSGFMIVGAGWYIFTTQGVYLALMLWGFERMFQRNSWWMFTLSVFVFSFNIPFDLYMAAILLFFYSTLRCIESSDSGIDWKRLLTMYGTMIIWGALGVFMSMAMLVSTVDQILNSPRVSGESAFFTELMSKSALTPVDTKQHLTIWGRLFSNDFFYGAQYELINNQITLPYKGWNNYLEAPALYCGLSTLLLLPQLMFYLDTRKRLIYGVGLLLAVLPLFFPFIRNTIWLYSGDYYRIFSLFVSVGLLLWGLHALDQIYKKQSVNLWVLAASTIFWLFLMFAPFMNSKDVAVDGGLRNILVIFLLAHAGAIAAMNFAQYRNSARIALLVLVAFEALYSGMSTYNSDRPVITKKEFKEKVGYNDVTVDAVKLLKEKDPSPFYRIEKSYKSGVAMHGSTNDAKVQDYFGSASYHSFNQKNYIRFLAGLDVIDAKDENQTRWASGVITRPLLQIISSTKYTLTQNNGMPAFFYTDFDSIGTLKIRTNPFFLPLGFTYDKVLEEATFEKMRNPASQSIKKQITLLKAMTLSAEDMTAFNALAKFDTNTVNVNYAPEELTNDVNALRAETLEISKFSQNHIVGKISVSKAKALFLSIPFDPSWSVKVDGQPAQLYLANMGFSALPLTAGEHSIELQFTPPYWTLSILMTVLGFVVFGGLIWWTRTWVKPYEGVEEVLVAEEV